MDERAFLNPAVWLPTAVGVVIAIAIAISSVDSYLWLNVGIIGLGLYISAEVLDRDH